MALDYTFLRCIWLICLCLCDYHCKVGSMKKGHLSNVKSWSVCSNSLTFFSLLISVFNLLAVTWPTPCHELTCVLILLRKTVATVSVTASSRRTRTNFLRGMYSTYILNNRQRSFFSYTWQAFEGESDAFSLIQFSPLLQMNVRKNLRRKNGTRAFLCEWIGDRITITKCSVRKLIWSIYIHRYCQHR